MAETKFWRRLLSVLESRAKSIGETLIELRRPREKSRRVIVPVALVSPKKMARHEGKDARISLRVSSHSLLSKIIHLERTSKGLACNDAFSLLVSNFISVRFRSTLLVFGKSDPRGKSRDNLRGQTCLDGVYDRPLTALRK